MKTNSQASTKQSISQLEEAFGIFNRVSADLGTVYRDLENSVAGLKEELAASNSARIRELTAKERLAAKLSALMDALPGGVVVIDASGTIREMNPGATELFGKSFIGSSWRQAIAQAAASDPVYDGELSLRDGKRISVISSLFGEEGEQIILATDITENYRLNRQINREKRLAALGEMAARLAHQVRTPLSSAILRLSNLSARLAAERSQESQRAIRPIQNQLGQIEKLVEGMLSYIKGDITASRRFSPAALLDEVRQATAPQVKAAGGSLQLSVNDHDITISGDREALFNALSNLVINAIQAVESRPRITLGLEQARNGVRLTVADNGPGIADDTKEQIFDPFFSTRPGGTGLGLAVVMSAVKAHGGEVSVDPSAAGGALFTLTIPSHAGDHTEVPQKKAVA